MNRLISEQGIDRANVSDISPAQLPPLRVVGEQKRSGLILCKPYYAEFSGPGAAIESPFNQAYSMIIAIGSPEIVEVTTPEERQKAYSRRIQWVRWLNKIVSHPDAVQRTEKLFAGFEEFFGTEVLVAIPDEVMALLAGVLPQTVALLRSQNPRLWVNDRHVPAKHKLDVEIWTSERDDLLSTKAHIDPVYLNSAKALADFPFSA